MSSKGKPHLNLVTVGHVDHGKSTLVGHLLYKLGFVDERTIQEYAKLSEKLGKGDSWKFAWVLDKLKEERERGLTIDLGFYSFETRKYYYTLVDAPGHRDFIKNMITGASQADVALLVVSAKKGEFETGISMKGQTVEHALLCRTLGVPQMVVAITKMDDPSVSWSKERYEEVKGAVEGILRRIGYDTSKIPFVPVSGWTGDNLVEQSSNMSWYDGPTLVEALDMMQVPPRPIDKPLRIPIQNVYSITGVGTVPVGRVETGIIRVGDQVVFMPEGVGGEVRSIEMHHTPLKEAGPGDNIGFNVRGISRTDVRRGSVAGHPDNPPTIVKEFIGQIIVVQHPTAIAAGYTPVMHAHTSRTPVQFAELIAKLDPRTGQKVEDNPSFLRAGDAAIVRFQLMKPVVIEEHAKIPQLGRFAIRDMGITVAVGVVKQITQTGQPLRR